MSCMLYLHYFFYFMNILYMSVYWDRNVAANYSATTGQLPLAAAFARAAQRRPQRGY